MIRNVRTVVVNEWKMAEFKPGFKRMLEYIQTRWPEINAQCFYQRFDVPNVSCYFTADFADLAELDRWLTEAGSDAEFVRLRGEIGHIPIPDRGGTRLLQSI